MPLTGELEHLPIVDVIQLIHSTRKSGTLNVYCSKGEGQLVFNSGYIVGATHSNEKMRIGQILCDSSIITEDNLKNALEVQQNASAQERKPLIATLLEHCGLSKESAFKALETLIELTIVEMISWSKGFFSLEIDKIHTFDEYRYLPTQLQELNLDTQMVLMDALRLFDEKVHAGEIKIVDEPLDEIPEKYTSVEPEESNEEEIVVSEDILGLADLDKIERKKPHVFKSLEAFDPSDIHRQVIKSAYPDIPENVTTEITNYLVASSPSLSLDQGSRSQPPSQAIILYSCDEFLQHAVMTICKNEGQLVFVTSDGKQLDDTINRALSKQLEPILVLDAPSAKLDSFSPESLKTFRARKMELFPELAQIQLVAPDDYTFSLEALKNGVRTVFPRPHYSAQSESFAADSIAFLEALKRHTADSFNAKNRQHFEKMRKSLASLNQLSKAPEISSAVLQFVGDLFERSLTLIVDRGNLVSERSVGLTIANSFKFAIPEDSIFQHVINDGELFFGPLQDSALDQHLFSEIGAPLESSILLLPLQSNNRTITLTYADFGNVASRLVPIEFIEFFAAQAGITLENALFRKQISKSTKPLQQQ